jgi:hypothetical protein
MSEFLSSASSPAPRADAAAAREAPAVAAGKSPGGETVAPTPTRVTAPAAGEPPAVAPSEAAPVEPPAPEPAAGGRRRPGDGLRPCAAFGAAPRQARRRARRARAGLDRRAAAVALGYLFITRVVADDLSVRVEHR